MVLVLLRKPTACAVYVFGSTHTNYVPSSSTTSYLVLVLLRKPTACAVNVFESTHTSYVPSSSTTSYLVLLLLRKPTACAVHVCNPRTLVTCHPAARLLTWCWCF